jgi:hypothetical protein
LRRDRQCAAVVPLDGQIYVIGGDKNSVAVIPCSGDCDFGALASVEVITPPP